MPCCARFLRTSPSRLIHRLSTARRARGLTDICLRPLDFCHSPRRYFRHPCSQRAPTGGACWRSGARRLRVRPSQPGLRGPRETPPGPTTWVRPETGWWKRMKAGESPLNQGRTVWAPLSVSRRRSRGLRKTPQWSAERRAGPRYGPAVPSRWRDRSDRKTGQRVRRSAPANFGAPLPSFEDAKGSKPTIWHDSPPGCAARQRSPTGQTNSRKSRGNDDAEVCAPKLSTVMPGLVPGIHALLCAK
jgi:hypothetical protein